MDSTLPALSELRAEHFSEATTSCHKADRALAEKIASGTPAESILSWLEAFGGGLRTWNSAHALADRDDPKLLAALIFDPRAKVWSDEFAERLCDRGSAPMDALAKILADRGAVLCLEAVWPHLTAKSARQSLCLCLLAARCPLAHRDSRFARDDDPKPAPLTPERSEAFAKLLDEAAKNRDAQKFSEQAKHALIDLVGGDDLRLSSAARRFAASVGDAGFESLAETLWGGAASAPLHPNAVDLLWAPLAKVGGARLQGRLADRKVIAAKSICPLWLVAGRMPPKDFERLVQKRSERSWNAPKIDGVKGFEPGAWIDSVRASCLAAKRMLPPLMSAVADRIEREAAKLQPWERRGRDAEIADAVSALRSGKLPTQESYIAWNQDFAQREISPLRFMWRAGIPGNPVWAAQASKLLGFSLDEDLASGDGPAEERALLEREVIFDVAEPSAPKPKRFGL